jgi:hypothetical protein
MAEKNLQSKIKLYAESKDMLVFKVSAESQRGLPDLLIIANGRTALMEIKNPNGKGRLSALQQRTIEKISKRGIPVGVFDDFDIAKAFIDDL